VTATLIVAHSSNGVIGRSGQLPWRLPTDLARFKDLTWGGTVVMGRKTYESLPAKVRPLPGRTNIVVTRQVDFRAPGCIVAGSLEEALALNSDGSTFVMGGEQIYRAAFPLVDRILVTLIEDYVDGDTYFPPLGPEWIETQRSSLFFENDIQFRYLTYERRV
jgi:dihydrofolate reductase